jgi:hypothetical protein
MALLMKLQDTRRILLIDPLDLRTHPWVMERFFPLGPVWAIRAGDAAPPAPAELFQLNKELYQKKLVLPPNFELPKTRIEKELLGKYGMVWTVLCEALKTMRAGEMHEACSLMKQFQRKSQR